MKEWIPYIKHAPVTRDDLQAVEKALLSSHLTRGPLTIEFEEAIAEFLDKRYAVAFCNGTAAIACAGNAIGAKVWNVADVTFISVANALRSTSRNPEVKAVGISHNEWIAYPQPNGVSCDLAGYVPPVHVDIEDASHSLGNPLVGKRAQVVVASLHATKNLGVGEGGIAATDDEDLYLIMRSARNMGRDFGDVGINFHPHETACALGLSRLKRINEYRDDKLEIIRKYKARLHGMVRFQQWHEQEVNPHLCIIRSPKAKQVERVFGQEFIEFAKHYKPLSLQGYKQSVSSLGGTESFKYWQECVSLPLYPGMSHAHAERVIEAVERAHA